MRLAMALIAAFVISTTPVLAKPYVLKCTYDHDPEPLLDLIVDLDQMTMSWGMKSPNYIINKITDRYITAVRNEKVWNSDVGGEVWVIDRFTGAFKRTDVGLFCNNSACKGGSTVLRAYAYSGKCASAMFYSSSEKGGFFCSFHGRPPFKGHELTGVDRPINPEKQKPERANAPHRVDASPQPGGRQTRNSGHWRNRGPTPAPAPGG